MLFDRTHLMMLLLGTGLGTIIHFVDWDRVQASSTNTATAIGGVASTLAGVAIAIKFDQSKLMDSRNSFTVVGRNHQSQHEQNPPHRPL